MTIKTIASWLKSRARTKPFTGIVLHASGGSNASGAVSWLEKIGLSYHYIIDKDGTVTKLVPLSRVAFHAGESLGWDGKGCNGYTIGVCLANRNDGKDPYTDEQYASCKALVAELASGAPTLKYITTHKAVAVPKGRKTDPVGFEVNKVKGPLVRWRCV